MTRMEEHLTAAGMARILSEKHGLGGAPEIFRLLRHLTAQGLLPTVGTVNTGSGRKRLYSQPALIVAAVLLRLHKMGATVGLMKQLMQALARALKKSHRTSDIVRACEGMERPTLFVIVPDRSHSIEQAVRLMNWEGAKNALERDEDVDVLMVQINRFLR
jgi:hypothetical protein